MGCGASVEQNDDAASFNEDAPSTNQVPPTAILLSLLSLENLNMNSFTGPYLCITSRSIRRVTKRFTKVEPDGSLTLPQDSVITFPVIAVDPKEIFRNSQVSVTVFARDSQGKDRPIASGDFTLDPEWLGSANGFDGEMQITCDIPGAKSSPPAKIGFHIAPSSMFPATAPGLDEMPADFMTQQDEIAAAIVEMTRKMRLEVQSQTGQDSSLRRQPAVDSPSGLRRHVSDSPSGASTRRQLQVDVSPQTSRRSTSYSSSNAQQLSSAELDDLLSKIRAEKNATSREVHQSFRAFIVKFANTSWRC